MQFLFNQDREDLVWGEATDFTIKNGDLEDTRLHPGKAFVQEVLERTKSAKNDWKLDRAKGASLEQFEGELNTEETWGKMSSVISQEFTKDMFLLPTDFSIFIAPISLHEVGIRIDFAQEIVYNFGEEASQVNLIYNTDSNRMFIVS